MKYSIKCLLKDFAGYFSNANANFHQLDLKMFLYLYGPIQVLKTSLIRPVLTTDLILLIDCGIFSSNLTIKFERKLAAKTAQRSRAVRIFLVKTQSVILDLANLKKVSTHLPDTS